MKISKAISIILVASMILSLSACNKAPVENIPAVESSGAIDLTDAPGVKDAVLVTDADSLKEKEMPLYYRSPDDVRTIKLYFADKGKEIPYLDTGTVKELLENIYHDFRYDKDYALNVSTEGHKAIFTRENNSTMVIDCDENTIWFDNYDAFLVYGYSNTIIDPIDSIDKFPFLDESEDRSYSRNGSEVCFYLDPYAIDLIENEGECYIPMQTFSDLLTSSYGYVNFLYNGKSVFVNDCFSDYEEALLEKYYDTKVKNINRSKKLAEFSYQELCLVMDYCYGLKEKHNITSFDQYFIETGIKESLLSSNMIESSKALSDLMVFYLSDGHCFYDGNSYRLGEDFIAIERYGQSIEDFFQTWSEIDQIRNEYYPDGIPGYEEIGNTAYITFDSFDSYPSDADYYNNPPTPDSTDTMAICLYAFSRITRKDSPIENVVLDLSENTGGDVSTAFFVIGMFIGQFDIFFEDPLTGAYVNNVYQCDANLDGKFDENDALSGYRLFCLTSPVSFSCGNDVPYIFKYSNKVNMLGMPTGGGACVVMPLSLADGTRYQISGLNRAGYLINGSVYDIDAGLEPDYPISSYARFYDRKALTKYINSIY